MTKQHLNMWVLILTFSYLDISVWAAIGIGYSDPFTIDRRVEPIVSNLEPIFGAPRGGDTVTVKGDKFYSGLTTVKLGGISINPIIKSETELHFETPGGDIGLVDLEIFNPKGISTKLSKAFKYQAPVVEKVEVKADVDTLVANGVSNTQITFRLLDQFGDLVTNETISLLANRGAISAQSNNKDGTYVATYTSGQTPGKATVTVVTTTNGKLGEIELTLVPRQVSAEKSTVTLTKNWAIIGQEGPTLAVKLVDKQGLVMEGLVVEAKVEPVGDVTVSIAQPTDLEGLTQLRIQSSVIGQRIVTLSVGEITLSSEAKIRFTSNQVTSVLVDVNRTQKVGKLVTATITLENVNRFPVSGQRVEVLVAPNAGVTVTQPTQNSDAQGKLKAELFSQTAGLKKLKFRWNDSLLEDSTTIIFQADSVDKLKMMRLEKTSLRPGTPTILVVSVTDQYNNPLKEIPVRLKTNLGQIGSITDKEDGTYLNHSCDLIQVMEWHCQAGL